MPRASRRGAGLQSADDDPFRKLLVLQFSAKSLGLRQDDERRLLVADALRADPFTSDRSIGRRLGVGHHSVASVRTALERAGDIPRVRIRTDSTGRRQRRA
jgi:hypothetical protein